MLCIASAARAACGFDMIKLTIECCQQDIFTINQKQLESAVRRITGDPGLEPQRKDYLVQHIMASRYVVAQQMRLEDAVVTPSSDPARTFAAKCVTGPYMLCSVKQARVCRSVRSPTARLSGTVLILHNTWLRCTSSITNCCVRSGELGCGHYKRKCKVVAPCCDRAYTCRECHDEAEPDHEMDSKAVDTMVCMECNTRQHAARASLRLSLTIYTATASLVACILRALRFDHHSRSEHWVLSCAGDCSHCGAVMATYYCSICHLWDNNSANKIYHCPYCNLCRQGQGLGLDSCHCMECNTCMHLADFPRHRCRKLNPCPICQENLYESTKPYRVRHHPRAWYWQCISANECSARQTCACMVCKAEHDGVCATGAASVRALHALALLQAAHAGVLHVPAVLEIPWRHDSVLPGMAALPCACLRSLYARTPSPR